jgi:hypothetical protein
MDLKKKTFSTELYRWFYGVKKIESITNGCEYIWKLILAYFLVIPLSIFTLPIVILCIIGKDKIGDTSIYYRISITILLYFSLFLLIGFGVLISTFWVDYEPKSWGSVFCIGGVFFILITSIILVLWGWDKLTEYLEAELSDDYDEKGNKIPKKPKLLILVLYKSIKEKNCPRITWKD